MSDMVDICRYIEYRYTYICIYRNSVQAVSCDLKYCLVKLMYLTNYLKFILFKQTVSKTKVSKNMFN